MDAAYIGFRAKTARAIAIALTSTSQDAVPQFIARWEVALVDPHSPATAQPHHEVMRMGWNEALAAVRPIETRIEEVAVESMAAIVGGIESRGYRVRGAGIVGSPDRKLERIGNPHIRAHAAEGILFRRVLEAAASRNQLRSSVFRSAISKRSPFRSFSGSRNRLKPGLPESAVPQASPGAPTSARPPQRHG